MGLLKFRGGGGVVKKRQSPDFRSPEVGISALCHKAFAPPWKSYWMELLSTHKKVCGSAISVTERSCATSIAKAESRISDRSSYYT